MNPSAHRAQPEYEFSSVITTGMSAPPIDAVMWKPSAPDLHWHSMLGPTQMHEGA
jgi:hypothetical protein